MANMAILMLYLHRNMNDHATTVDSTGIYTMDHPNNGVQCQSPHLAYHHIPINEMDKLFDYILVKKGQNQLVVVVATTNYQTRPGLNTLKTFQHLFHGRMLVHLAIQVRLMQL